MLPGTYNNAYQIVQNRDYVLILSEMIHDAHIIPLDNRPHMGDAPAKPRSIQRNPAL